MEFRGCSRFEAPAILKGMSSPLSATLSTFPRLDESCVIKMLYAAVEKLVSRALDREGDG